MGLRNNYSLSTSLLSLARLLATIGIYVFHYLGLLGNSGYRLDFYAILIFCFMSGYFINVTKVALGEWVVKRYFGIMIPYWLVIFPVIFANLAFQYKTHLSFTDYAITIIGGNMFLNNPLYVIGWYITFVLLLYSYALAENYVKSWKKVVFMLIGLLIFFIWLKRGYYFASFIFGLRMSELCSVGWPKEAGSLSKTIALALFTAQKYCYAFFLIHGAVLLFFFEKTNMPGAGIFLISLLISLLMSIVLYDISSKFSIIAINKVLKNDNLRKC